MIPTDPKYRSRATASPPTSPPNSWPAGARPRWPPAVSQHRVGGIISPITAAGGVINDAVDFVRKGAAMAIFAVPNHFAEAAIDKVPWDVARGIGQKIRQTLYDWVKAEDDKLPSGAAGGEAPAAAVSLGYGNRSPGSCPVSSPPPAVLSTLCPGGVPKPSRNSSSTATWPVQATSPPGPGRRSTSVASPSTTAAHNPSTTLARTLGGNFPVRGEPWHGEVPGYQNGTNYVPRDGFAYLHKGEAVTPAGSGGRPIVVNIDMSGAVISSSDQFDEMVVSGLRRASERGVPITIQGRKL